MFHRASQRLLSTGSIRATSHRKPKILITGGRGQLGRGLAKELGKRHGVERVLLTDITYPTDEDAAAGFGEYLDVTNLEAYRKFVIQHRITWILHLPAMLSATCESRPRQAKEVNVDTMHHAFTIAKEFACKLFIPSSIGAFGPGSPLDAVPDVCYQDPRTIYGINKVNAEQFITYYHDNHECDFRCLRYPGIISAVAEPGGGTTDYAVDIYKQIVGQGRSDFECYLKSDARLPMMLEDDCVQGTCDFLEADNDKLSLRVYNLGAVDFTPAEVATELAKQYGDFEMKYNVCQMRQQIAESWPKKFVDKGARNDWGWQPKYDNLQKLTEYMIANIPKKE